MSIRAKFKCDSVTDYGDQKGVTLTAVVNDSPENKEFFKWTPSGRIELGVVNPSVKFEAGKEYYIDFNLAD